MTSLLIRLINWLKNLFSFNKNKQKQHRIKVQDIRTGKIDLGQLKELLDERVGRNLLFANSYHGIAGAALAQFDLPDVNSDSDIEKYAADLLAIFRPVEDYTSLEILSNFNELYLNVEGLPIKLKEILVKQTDEDLKALDNVMDYYKEHPKTKPIIEGKESSRHHQAYGMMEFYKRTQDKRAIIIDYRDNQLNNFVLSKSRPGFRSFSQLPEAQQSGPMELKEKYPYLDFVINDYKIAFVLDLEKLDWRLLNPVRNKIFAHTFTADYSQGYTTDIKKEILEDLDTGLLLDRLVEKIKGLPKVMGRTEIFEELRDLFNLGKFYGFYALAIPQVEGIFAEMSQLIQPNISTSGGLPEKVNRVRPHSETAHFDFDYYEYYLPDLRNKFSHLGKDDDIEFKSRCLILDLTNLITTCEDLSAPIIHLTNLINDGVKEISHIGHLAKILTLTDQTKKMPDFKDLNDKLNELIEVNLPDNFDIPGFINSLQAEYSKALEEISGFIKYSFHRESLAPENFAEMRPQDVITHMDKIKKAYNEYSFVIGEPTKFLFDVYDIGNLLPKLFSGIPTPIVTAINAFVSANTGSWENIGKIRNKKLDAPEDYFLLKEKRMAELSVFTKSTT